MHPTASWMVMVGISGVAVVVAAAVVGAHARQARQEGVSPWPFALGVLVWMVATFAIAASGLLARWDLRPPPFLIVAVGSIVAAVVVARSSVGRRLAGLPSWLLVAFASFRLVLELFMHAAAVEGTMPAQMTFGVGFNYDIVTGASALVVAAVLRRGPNAALLRAWNVLGLGLLLAIVTIAVVSTPAIAAFGPNRLNTWIAYAPFVWMIAVNVPAALLGHLVIFRRLRAEPVAQVTTSYSASAAM